MEETDIALMELIRRGDDKAFGGHWGGTPGIENPESRIQNSESRMMRLDF